MHEDFLRDKGKLRPGDLQWMTVGRGIVHSEMPASEAPARGLQLWTNLPRAKKMMEPAYQEIKCEDVPQVYNPNNTVTALLFAGSFMDQKGPITTQAPVSFIHFFMEKHAQLTNSLPEGHNAFLYVIFGDEICATTRIKAYDAIVLEASGDCVLFRTDEIPLQVILITGQPLHEPLARYGPFVMSIEEEIHQALRDFRNCKNGFENAKFWKFKIGNR
uniref:Pirin putative n=1 Tax=Albugo laibachii Nc14 TaxID=890382 RepID=F0WLY5_9STRA|nr:pirin putative [Albugo laibachii Nc14]|eukprot:CCA22312.1 pirin putative [Albugo laibachii Nc14]